jgi:hypothetical protein
MTQPSIRTGDASTLPVAIEITSATTLAKAMSATSGNARPTATYAIKIITTLIVIRTLPGGIGNVPPQRRNCSLKTTTVSPQVVS